MPGAEKVLATRLVRERGAKNGCARFFRGRFRFVVAALLFANTVTATQCSLNIVYALTAMAAHPDAAAPDNSTSPDVCARPAPPSSRDGGGERLPWTVSEQGNILALLPIGSLIGSQSLTTSRD